MKALLGAFLALLVGLNAHSADAYHPVGNEAFSIPPGYGLISRYDFHEGSGTVLHDVFGSNNLTINSGCTWTSVSLHIGSAPCGIQIPDALFNASRTIVVVATAQQGSSYRAIISSPSETAWYIDQDGYDVFTKNFAGSQNNSNRTYSVTTQGNVNIALGVTQMLSWARDNSADRFYIGPKDVGQYSSRSGSASFVASGTNLVFGGNPAATNLNFANDFFEILFFSQELTQSQIARVWRAERFIQHAKAIATGGGGVMNGEPVVAVMGASIWQGSTLPSGPGSGVQAGGWDVATLIAPGNNTASSSGQTNQNLIKPTVTFNNAIQGASGPTLSACVLENGNCNSSGGDAVVGAMWNYRIEAERSVLIDVLEVSNSIGAGYTASQLEANHQSVIGFLVPFYDVVSLTNPLVASTSSGSGQTYNLAYNADVLANSIAYGSTATFDFFNYPHAQDLSVTYRWDSTHFNQLGQTAVVTPAVIQALQQIEVY